MFFFKQFESFDPVSGYVPSYPFSYMPEIASRARALLNCYTTFEWDGRAKERITEIARRINQEIEDYFRGVRDTEIYRLQSELDVGSEVFETFFEWDGGTKENGRWLFKAGMEDELDIATEKNTSEVDALKAVIEKRDDHDFFAKVVPEPLEYPEGKDYELFAVLSLWLLADALSHLNESKHGLSIAGDYALKAMDAVCYAEHLREAAWIVSYAKKQGDTKLTEALQQQMSDNKIWVKSYINGIKERERLQKTARSKKLNLARHQKTNEAKAMVVEEFMKDRTKFPSAEKAGNHFADWLGTEGILNSATGQPYEPRTVTGWIRDHARKIGLRFR